MLKYSLKQMKEILYKIQYLNTKNCKNVVFFTFFNYIFVYILIKKI